MLERIETLATRSKSWRRTRSNKLNQLDDQFNNTDQYIFLLNLIISTSISIAQSIQQHWSMHLPPLQHCCSLSASAPLSASAQSIEQDWSHVQLYIFFLRIRISIAQSIQQHWWWSSPAILLFIISISTEISISISISTSSVNLRALMIQPCTLLPAIYVGVPHQHQHQLNQSNWAVMM